MSNQWVAVTLLHTVLEPLFMLSRCFSRGIVISCIDILRWNTACFLCCTSTDCCCVMQTWRLPFLPELHKVLGSWSVSDGLLRNEASLLFLSVLHADTQGTSGGISSRSLLLLLGSFRLAAAFCHMSARIPPQFPFIPFMDSRNKSVLQDSARTLLSHVSFCWVAKKSLSTLRCTASHAAQRSLNSLAMLSPWLRAQLLLPQQGKAPFQLTRSCNLCETGQAEWEPPRWRQCWMLKTGEICLPPFKWVAQGSPSLADFC